jgi:uncharacterized protein (DUF488 family)
MLRRQRTILKLLSTAGGSLSTTQVQKFLFLLRQETFLRSDSAFYEFLPYKFGPYSFAANREIDALVAYGYVEESSLGTSKNLTITSTGKKEGSGVEADVERAVLATLSQYGLKSVRGLMKDIYSRYPWYASNSEAKNLVAQGAPTLKIALPAVYTIGYEERSIDGFFEKLLRTGIRQIIDVRSNPVSRKFGFARSSMSSIAGKLDLDYVHRPELGITSEKRKGVQSHSDFQRLFGYYERRILAAKGDDIQEVSVLMKESPSVLVCMEKEAVDCHRSRLATRVAAISGLKIVHL